MKILRLVEPPDEALQAALEVFEEEFHYPLGIGRSFRISHGRDYSRFFRAIDEGSGASFVAVGKDGRVKGTLGVAVRKLQFPGGESCLAAYLGDLKTAPGVGRGWILLRMGVDVTAWAKSHGATVAYGVVMGGTSHEPSAYTGKLGIYPFRKVSDLVVLRIPVPENSPVPDARFIAEPSVAAEMFARLGRGAFVPLGGNAPLRSSIPAMALADPNGAACGVLEDTRLAKRLIETDGDEMMSVHLSQFAYSNLPAGVTLLRQALAQCAARSLAPAMFVSIPTAERADFLAALGECPGLVEAPASVYGTWPDLCGDRWRINTAEI